MEKTNARLNRAFTRRFSLAFFILSGRGTTWLLVQENRVSSENKHRLKEMAINLLGDMSICEVFYVLRRRADINQADIAKQTNIQSVLLSMFERGTVILQEEDIEKLLIAYTNVIQEMKEREVIAHE